MKTMLLPFLLTVAVCQVAAQDAAELGAGVDVGEGKVQFITEIEIPALTSGKLKQVSVRDYQFVKGGDLIASLDDRALKDRQQVTEIGRQLLSNKLKSDLQRNIADTAYREAKTRHEANLTSQAASPGSVASLELSRSALALKRAELESQSVEEQKHDLLLELSVKDAEVARVEHELSQTLVTSPISGVVLSVAKQTGEWINVGETLATVAGMDRLQVPIILNEQQLLHRNAAGTSVVLQWKENDESYSMRGYIASVEPMLRSEDGYRAIVEVENRMLSNGWLLTPGRKVSVTVYPQTRRQVPVSPATARLLQDPSNPSTKHSNR